MTTDITSALDRFNLACQHVHDAGLDQEVDWHRSRRLNQFTETDLLREAAWVILCSGFREAVVKSAFDHVSLCFCDWESADEILSTSPTCKRAARASFRNERKLDAILAVAILVDTEGFQRFKSVVMADPITELQRSPFIGDVTVWNLAKNLGCDVAKPDRHLLRISHKLGFRDADDFCGALSDITGEQRKVIDLIVWRYLPDNPGYLDRVPRLTPGQDFRDYLSRADMVLTRMEPRRIFLALNPIYVAISLS